MTKRLVDGCPHRGDLHIRWQQGLAPADLQANRLAKARMKQGRAFSVACAYQSAAKTRTRRAVIVAPLSKS